MPCKSVSCLIRHRELDLRSTATTNCITINFRSRSARSTNLTSRNTWLSTLPFLTCLDCAVLQSYDSPFRSASHAFFRTPGYLAQPWRGESLNTLWATCRTFLQVGRMRYVGRLEQNRHLVRVRSRWTPRRDLRACNAKCTSCSPSCATEYHMAQASATYGLPEARCSIPVRQSIKRSLSRPKHLRGISTFALYPLVPGYASSPDDVLLGLSTRCCPCGGLLRLPADYGSCEPCSP